MTKLHKGKRKGLRKTKPYTNKNGIKYYRRVQADR